MIDFTTSISQYHLYALNIISISNNFLLKKQDQESHLNQHFKIADSNCIQ